MLALVASAVAAFFALAAASFASELAKRARTRRLRAEISLRPNVLLCARPVAFVFARKSAFWRDQTWCFAPECLASHGFDARVIEVSGSDPSALGAAIGRIGRSCHLVFHGGDERLARAAAEARMGETVTVFRSRRRPPETPRALAPPTNLIYEIEAPRARRPRAAFAGAVTRAALALHRARVGTSAPFAEEVAAGDEGLTAELTLLAHAETLAERDLKFFRPDDSMNVEA